MTPSELLSATTVISLMLALLIPATTQSTNESRRHQSLENLRRIGQLSETWAVTTGVRHIIHPQSSVGETGWRGLGAWDWGGSDGTDLNLSGNNLAGRTRPLSKLGSPGLTLMFDDFSVFHAAADRGQVPNNPVYGGDTPDSLVSMAKSKGTSYQGDFIWYPAENNTGRRFGTFMRAFDQIPVPSETTLFYEARFAQAFMSSQEFVAGGAFGGVPTDVPGWYDTKPKFAVLFADHSVRMVRIRKQGDMYPINSFDPVVYPTREVMARGPGWRIDCFPAPFVIEHMVGDP